MRYTRKSGVLLHPVSLPGHGGIGSLGEYARGFVDFLQEAGQSLWQILPLGPTAYGNSPYACYSAFAGNPLLINLETIVQEGDLASTDLRDDLPEDRVDYQLVEDYKFTVLRKAAANFFFGRDGGRRSDEFFNFCETTSWLHDFALFMVLKEHYQGKSWCDWPEEITRKKASAMASVTSELADCINEKKYMQWQFSRQWRKIKEYANSKGIAIIGDIPIFVAYDSADVWANPHLFQLDEKGRPTVVAGVPPDYFSKTGQLWGNPLYNWERVAYHGYDWWIDRFRSALSLHDMIRVDHFRGFEAHWEVPADEKTAVNGRWVKGPGEALFHALNAALGKVPIIAEDLGYITPDVEALRDKLSFPGMRILQFAFGSDPYNPYLPHNHIRESVVYTGTHDNDTTVGWYASLSSKEKRNVCRYLNISGDDIAWDLIRAALVSVADTVILPLQDILALPSTARMNLPGSSSGNWSWRFNHEALSEKTSRRLLDLTKMYGRCQPQGHEPFKKQTG
jgi:4-alpha-glucanotransferase